MNPLDIMGPLSMVSSGMSAASGIGKSIYGMVQLLTNKRPELPTYQIPEEVKQALRLAQIRAANPNPQHQAVVDQMDQGFATSLANINSLGGTSGASLGAVADLYGKQLGAANQVAIREYENQAAAESRLAQQLGVSADYKDKAFDLNFRQPYEQAMSEFFSNRQAGVQNLFGGMNDVVGAGNQYMQNQYLIDLIGNKKTE